MISLLFLKYALDIGLTIIESFQLHILHEIRCKLLPKTTFLPYETTFNLCVCSQTIDELLNSSYYSDFKKKPHNALLSVISEILNLKVSNVDIAWSQHDNNKDVDADSSFFFFTLLNLSENYFHKSQTNKCHGNVNGGNIHTSSAGVNDMIFLPFRYSIPDTPYSVPAAVGTSELSSLINQILKGTQSYVNKLVLIQG